MDFHMFPFDRQTCSLHLESSISTTKTLRLKWRDVNPFTQTDSFRTIGFVLEEQDLIETEKTYSKNNTFSRVSVNFILARQYTHYIFLLYLPTAIIVVSSWSSFWLEITSPPARVSIGVTTMLAIVTTFRNTKSQLPSLPYWNALDIWNMVSIGKLIYLIYSVIFTCTLVLIE